MRTKPSIADFAREYAADVIECRRDHLAWPGHADEEELRQRGRDKHQHRGLALLEKTAGRLTHKAGGEHERHREERQIRDPAQCRKSVYSRQDDKEQGQRRSVDRQMREAAAKELARPRRNFASCAASFEAECGQCRRSHQQSLLDDQHESSRHHITGIASSRIVQRLGQELGWAERGQDQSSLRAVDTQTPRNVGEIGVGGTLGDPCKVRLNTRKYSEST